MFNSTGLLPPQIPHTKKLLDSLYLNGFAIDASETGTGKTFCAAAVVRAMNRPAFIIAPKSVIPAWEKVLAIFGLKATIVNYEKLSRGNTKWMTWRKMRDLMYPWKEGCKTDRPMFYIPRNAVVVLDEGHRCKGINTSNSEMMISLAEQGYKCLVSSATIATTPLEMKAVGYLSQLHKLYNFTDFCRVHGAQWVGRWGALTFDAASKEAQDSMGKLHDYLFSQMMCASRLVKEDFGNSFPESQILPTAFDLGANGPKIQAVYDDMEAEIARLEERCESYSEHIFAILMEARRRAELLKVPVMVEKIQDLHDEGKSVAVFVNFTETISAITRRLGKKYKSVVAYIVGGQSSRARQADIEAFQSDKKTIILCNIAAGGVGVNLHDLIGDRPRASIVSPTWSAINLQQCFGRIWRQGGKTKSIQYIVYAANCVEEQICRRVSLKLTSLSSLNDGDLAETVRYLQG